MSEHSKAQINKAVPPIADAPDTDRGSWQNQSSPAPETAADITAARSARLRENLLRLIARQRLTLAQLARRSGMPTANALYNFTKGRSASLSQQTLERICDAIPGITIDALVGRPPGKPGGDHPVPSKAACTAAARATALALDRLSGSLAALSIVLDAAGNAATEASQCAKALLAAE